MVMLECVKVCGLQGLLGCDTVFDIKSFRLSASH